MANPYKKPWTETVSNRRAGCIERVHVRFGKGWSGTYLQRQRTGRLLHAAIKLVYPGKTGKPVGLFHTPDFFLLLTSGAGWAECKMEEPLPHLAEQMPHRYVHNADRTWSSPPGEASAQPFGLFYRLQSSAQIDWVYQRNLRFLEDYLRFSRAPVSTEVNTAIRTLVRSKPALSLLEVLEGLQTETPDDVYALIASEQLYVDLSHTPLADAGHVQVFVDREQAAAYSTLSQSAFHLFPGSSSHSLVPGTLLWWDGKPWRLLNLGETAITLLSPEKRVIAVSPRLRSRQGFPSHHSRVPGTSECEDEPGNR